MFRNREKGQMMARDFALQKKYYTRFRHEVHARLSAAEGSIFGTAYYAQRRTGRRRWMLAR